MIQGLILLCEKSRTGAQPHEHVVYRHLIVPGNVQQCVDYLQDLTGAGIELKCGAALDATVVMAEQAARADQLDLRLRGVDKGVLGLDATPPIALRFHRPRVLGAHSLGARCLGVRHVPPLTLPVPRRFDRAGPGR